MCRGDPRPWLRFSASKMHLSPPPPPFDVRSVLHEQVSLTAANHICVIHEAMNGCKKSKGSSMDCFENVNICEIDYRQLEDRPLPLKLLQIKWASSRQNLSSGFPSK